MKTLLIPRRIPALKLSAFCLSVVCLSLHAGKKTSPPPIEHKDYTLFMGADFQIQKDGKMYPVVDVQGDSFVIKVDGERVLVPVDRRQLKLKASEELKITAEDVPVRNLTMDRAYTPARDPRKKFLREANAMLELQDTTPEINRQIGAKKDYNATMNNPYATPQMKASATANLNKTDVALTQAEGNALNTRYGGGTAASEMQRELAKELFDAMEIQFKVSSPKQLDRPYVIVVARYRNPDDRPNEARNWIFAQQLKPIGEHERNEHFLQGGLTPGFTLISTEFHLYNEGRELATAIAHKRVPLTREEAYEYSIIEYIEAHKSEKAKVAPVPAMGNLASDFLIHLSPDEVQGTFFVKVGADGKARDVYRDEACTMKVENAFLASGLKSIWFEPAVEKGKAVEGVATIHPNRIHYVFDVKT